MYRVVAAGASTVDLKARAIGPETHGGCVPGRIVSCPGGTARNIAENLARLSIHTYLLSAVGTDGHGTEVVTQSALAGVDLSRLLSIERARTATFLAVLDQKGAMRHGLQDTGILEMVSGDYLDRQEDLIQKADLVLADTSLSIEALRRISELATRHKRPLALAPTPNVTMTKVRSILKDTLLVTPNRREAQLLTGIDTSTDEGVQKVAGALLEQGVKLVLITLGADGVYFRSRDDEVRLPAHAREIVDRMGAGDAFTAGFLYGFLHTLPLLKALEIGQFTASLTLDTVHNVHPKLRLDYIHSSIV
jgi:pseudouridine kinase